MRNASSFFKLLSSSFQDGLEAKRMGQHQPFHFFLIFHGQQHRDTLAILDHTHPAKRGGLQVGPEMNFDLGYGCSFRESYSIS
jgi:hypothetical protein